MQAQDLEFGLQVHLVIVSSVKAILHRLPILRHQDDRRLNSREHGKEEIQQNKRIRIKRSATMGEEKAIEQNP